MVMHACHSNYARKHKYENHSPHQPGHKVRHYLKAKWYGLVAQVVECWSNKCEALSSTFCTNKSKKKLRAEDILVRRKERGNENKFVHTLLSLFHLTAAITLLSSLGSSASPDA
jgi:hypothetical protein